MTNPLGYITKAPPAQAGSAVVNPGPGFNIPNGWLRSFQTYVNGVLKTPMWARLFSGAPVLILVPSDLGVGTSDPNWVPPWDNTPLINAPGFSNSPHELPSVAAFEQFGYVTQWDDNLLNLDLPHLYNPAEAPSLYVAQTKPEKRDILAPLGLAARDPAIAAYNALATETLLAQFQVNEARIDAIIAEQQAILEIGSNQVKLIANNIEGQLADLQYDMDQLMDAQRERSLAIGYQWAIEDAQAKLIQQAEAEIARLEQQLAANQAAQEAALAEQLELERLAQQAAAAQLELDRIDDLNKRSTAQNEAARTQGRADAARKARRTVARSRKRSRDTKLRGNKPARLMLMGLHALGKVADAKDLALIFAAAWQHQDGRRAVQIGFEIWRNSENGIEFLKNSAAYIDKYGDNFSFDWQYYQNAVLTWAAFQYLGSLQATGNLRRDMQFSLALDTAFNEALF